MQLDTGGSGSNLQSEINITPLVDVVLVLLIIFMVVVPLLMRGYNVDIPRTSNDAVSAQTAEARLVLKVEAPACRLLGPPAGEGLPADCRVTLGDQQIPVNELPERVASILGNRPVEKRVLFLAADDRVNYEGVMRILDLAKSDVEDLQVEFITTH